MPDDDPYRQRSQKEVRSEANDLDDLEQIIGSAAQNKVSVVHEMEAKIEHWK